MSVLETNNCPLGASSLLEKTRIHSLGQRTIVKVEIRTITLKEFWESLECLDCKVAGLQDPGKRDWKCYWASACSTLSLIVSEDTEFGLMVVKQSLLL